MMSKDAAEFTAPWIVSGEGTAVQLGLTLALGTHHTV
jgi:hypothetical protein